MASLWESFQQHKTASLLCLGTGLGMFVYLLFQTTFSYTPVEPPLFKRMMWIIGLVLIALFLFAFWALCYQSMRLHRLAAILLPLLGLVYMTVIQINGSFDEDAHIPTVYHYANVLFGIDDSELEPQLMYMRADDAIPLAFDDPALAPGEDPGMIIRPLTKAEYADYWSRFGEPLRDETLVPVRQNRLVLHRNILPHQYVFSVIGMVIGRILKLGTYDLYRLCRLTTLLFSTLLTVWAVRLMPVRKSLLLLLAMMPLTVQQSMSVSYDPFVNSLAFWLISAHLYVAYGTAPDPQREKRFYLALIAVFSVLLAASKQFAYIAFLALPFYTAYRAGMIQKKTFRRIFAGAVILAVVVVVAFFVRYRTAGAASPVNEFVPHLMMRIRLYAHTLVEQMGTLFLMSIGSVLGALLIDTATMPVFFFVPLLLLASVKRSDERRCVDGLDRFCFIALFLICLTAASFGHMRITALFEKTIFGLQGRYILPVMLPLLYSLATDRLELKQNADALIIPGGVCLNFLLVMNILANAG